MKRYLLTIAIASLLWIWPEAIGFALFAMLAPPLCDTSCCGGGGSGPDEVSCCPSRTNPWPTTVTVNLSGRFECSVSGPVLYGCDGSASVVASVSHGSGTFSISWTGATAFCNGPGPFDPGPFQFDLASVSIDCIYSGSGLRSAGVTISWSSGGSPISCIPTASTINILNCDPLHITATATYVISGTPYDVSVEVVE